MYTNLKALLVKAANKDKFDEEFINKEQLKMHLSILSSNISCEPTHELHTVIKYLQGLSAPQRLLFSEECVLASLMLVMPATNAVSERSISFASNKVLSESNHVPRKAESYYGSTRS